MGRRHTAAVLPVIEADPRVTIYVEVGTERDNWSIMHAWLVPRSEATTFTASNDDKLQYCDALLARLRLE